MGLRDLSISMMHAQRFSIKRGMRLQRPCHCGCLSPSEILRYASALTVLHFAVVPCDLHVIPIFYFLPSQEKTKLSVSYKKEAKEIKSLQPINLQKLLLLF